MCSRHYINYRTTQGVISSNKMSPLKLSAVKQSLLKIHFTLLILSYFAGFGNTYMVDDNPYHQRHTLDSKGNYQLDWLVHWNEKRLSFNVTVRTRGYVGFGLSSNGKMSGADIVIGGVFPNGTSYFADYHAVGNQLPEVDPNQDWILNSAWENGTHTSLNFSRAFDTCDDRDYPINNDKVSLIWAYGEEDDDLEYHFQNRGVFNTYLLDPDYTPHIIRDANNRVTEVVGEVNSDVKVWTIRNELDMPVEDTTYWCTMYKAPQLSRKHHIVGVDVTFGDDVSIKHVHHLLIHKCNPAKGRQAKPMFEPFVGQRGQRCLMWRAPQGPMPTEFCTETVHIWGIGGRAYFNPPHVGLPFGVSPDEYYIIQVHYDNPNRLPNIKVDLQLDIFYSSKLRPNDGGGFQVRIPNPGLTPSVVIPPSEFEHVIRGQCSPEFTSRIFPKTGIKVYSILLHSHNSGRQLRLQHFRGNKELHWLANDDNYQNTYQQFRTLQKEVRVLPGDHIVMRCVYDNTWTNGTVVGGFSTRQEMCTNFVFYYHKINDYSICGSEINSTDAAEYRNRILGINNITWSIPQMEYIVNTPKNLAGLKITEVSDNYVTWDRKRREELQTFHLTQQHTGICSRDLYAVDPHNIRTNSDGLFENIGEPAGPVLYPFQARPYQPKPTCSA